MPAVEALAASTIQTLHPREPGHFDGSNYAIIAFAIVVICVFILVIVPRR
jgi:hypothetical protein